LKGFVCGEKVGSAKGQNIIRKKREYASLRPIGQR